jgi:nitronate monooxygenase
MAGVQDSTLTIAVCMSGAIGSLPCAMLSSQALVRELDSIISAGCRLYNLNFFCHKQPPVDQQRESKWRSALDQYYREYRVQPESNVGGAARQPFTADTLELIRPYRPPIVSFHFGLPEREWIDQIKSWGGMIWSSATTLEEALWLEQHGADAVIAQGVEAGGHRGMFLTDDLSTQTGTARLVEVIRDEVSLPVIAAGGIASPGSVRQLIENGAWAVQIGTAYLCCLETRTSPVHRRLLGSEYATSTQLTNLFSGRPARGIMNRLMKELGPISSIVPEFPHAAAALAPLRAAAEAQGKSDFSPLWCGTDATGCREVSAKEQTLWLATELT